ncbi:MAG: SIMPL domain-containing protein [Pseudomonadota bacterium]
MKLPFNSMATLRLAAPAAALVILAVPAACAQAAPMRIAQEDARDMAHPNSIQPETTLSITATGEVMAEPDIAYVSTGVQSEAKTAEQAMADNRAAMNGVFEALRAAGLTDRDIQTSNFSLNPVYDYIEREDGRGNERVLRGYMVSNQVTAKVSDLDNLGRTLDAVVSEGGNTFNGIRFALEHDTEVRDEARRSAMEQAIARAELYASAAGYEVARIVSITEYEHSSGPQPMMEMAMARTTDSATPVSGGEVGYSSQVNVLFELSR